MRLPVDTSAMVLVAMGGRPRRLLWRLRHHRPAAVDRWPPTTIEAQASASPGERMALNRSMGEAEALCP